jgi:hypothetical protein
MHVSRSKRQFLIEPQDAALSSIATGFRAIAPTPTAIAGSV